MWKEMHKALFQINQRLGILTSVISIYDSEDFDLFLHLIQETLYFFFCCHYELFILFCCKIKLFSWNSKEKADIIYDKIEN